MNEDRNETTPPADDHTEDLSRKRFLDWILGTSVGGVALAVVYPVGRYLIPPENVESTATSATLTLSPSDLAPNSGAIFKFGSRPGLLIKTPSGELRAFSARCTHLDCTVQYRDDLEHIWCACHNGHYDLTGRNISGPPPRPLDAYDADVQGDEIIISRRA